MISKYHKIRKAIMGAVSGGKKNFIIYPYGENGIMTKQILSDSFGIEECYILDNELSKYNIKIKSLDICANLDVSQYSVLYTCENSDIYDELRNNLNKYFTEDNIVEIFEKIEVKVPRSPNGVWMKSDVMMGSQYGTKCGKYSMGTLCDHYLVESCGAFCSFAAGSDVVENHPVNYLSTHHFMYYGGDSDAMHERTWDELDKNSCYFSGINPKGKDYKLKKILIGNDVWLGRNVLITNGSNIGNGVIAGAGAVITKDVPDYAVVVGVPARIIRYRYEPDEIAALNRIAWWDWPDEKIRKNYNDFYLDIKEFIKKYDVSI